MFIGSLMLNIIYVLFPIFCYFLYVVYKRTVGKKENDLFFDLSLLSSVYLLLKYGSFNDYIYNVVFINVILIIAFYKRRYIVSAFLSIYFIYYYYEYLNFNLIILFLKYLILYLLYLNHKSKSYLVISFGLISMLFDVILTMDLYICIYCLLYLLICYFIIELLDRTDIILKLNLTIKQLEKEKSLRDSIFKITHEIKNPIAVCKGYLDMLDTNNKSQVNKYIPIIREEINRTLTLMADFLDLTRLKVEKVELDISLLLEDICSSIETLVKANNIKFDYLFDCDDVYILGDYDRLKQVLLNMIKNSIESINKEGIINFKAYCNSKYLIIEIKDNGVGMNKETLKKLGESFFSTKKNGTGLGVKLSKEIIEAHNGTIDYKSKEGIGTTVTIKIPKK